MLQDSSLETSEFSHQTSASSCQTSACAGRGGPSQGSETGLEGPSISNIFELFAHRAESITCSVGFWRAIRLQLSDFSCQTSLGGIASASRPVAGRKVVGELLSLNCFWGNPADHSLAVAAR